MAIPFFKKFYQKEANDEKAIQIDNRYGEDQSFIADQNEITPTVGVESVVEQTVDYDMLIAEKKALIEKIQNEIRTLLAQKVNSTPELNHGWEANATVYYPAPPQKDIIACKLEVEEDAHGGIVFFARPICYKKDGSSVLSKRHYLLGSDLSLCADLYKVAPPNAKIVRLEDEEKTPIRKPRMKRKNSNNDQFNVADLMNELKDNPELVAQLREFLNE